MIKKFFSKPIGLFLSLLFTIIAILSWQSIGNAQTACKFAPTTQITSINQAKCLLRQPKIFGNVGPTLTSLPSPLDLLLSQGKIDLDKATLRRYLTAQNIREADLGGSLDEPVSRANNNSSNAEFARYFTIHDTSAPNFKSKPFPAEINQVSWSGNKLQDWTKGTPLAHVFINRVGQSITVVNFKTPWRATVFESKKCGDPCKGLFLNVEMVQPRRSSPPGTSGNDALAPTPGFTDAQLDRLALVYIAASVRRGKWLIPAFHVVVDIGVGDHDDPQNFDLEQWAKRLDTLLVTIRS